MKEQAPSSQDLYVSRMARKMQEAEQQEQTETKEMLTDRLIERIGDISKQKRRYERDFQQAGNFNERLNVLTNYFELQAEEQRLKNIFDNILKPSREELMYGDEPLSTQDEKLLEKETPYLLVGGKKPIELTKRKTLPEETVLTAPESGVYSREALAEVPLYRSDEPSLPAIKRGPSLEQEEEIELQDEDLEEKIPTKKRLTPERSEENALLESIDREARKLPDAKRLAFYQKQRDKILDNLGAALMKPLADEAAQELLVNRLEERFHTIQGRVSEWRKIHEGPTRRVEKPEELEKTDIDIAAE